MDINNHHKFTNTTTTSWDSINGVMQLPYNIMSTTASTTITPPSSLDHERIFLHHENPSFDHHSTQWPTYYQNSPSSTGYLPTPSSHNYLLSINQPTADDGKNLPKADHSQEMEDHEHEEDDDEEEELGGMKEMMFKIAAMQPVDIDPATIRKPRRRNVRISDDPQSVAARHRRERISEKVRILQRLVPGGTKMDTATMLDEAIRYVKFLKRQIRILQANQNPPPALGENQATTSYLFGGGNDPHSDHMAGDNIISNNPIFFNHN